eukprot:11217874-Lingulodinium_polyedra.AAC.1
MLEDLTPRLVLGHRQHGASGLDLRHARPRGLDARRVLENHVAPTHGRNPILGRVNAARDQDD